MNTSGYDVESDFCARTPLVFPLNDEAPSSILRHLLLTFLPCDLCPAVWSTRLHRWMMSRQKDCRHFLDQSNFVDFEVDRPRRRTIQLPVVLSA